MNKTGTLREGYTTGSCAAAAAKAAVLLLDRGEKEREMDIPLPDGKRLSIPIVDLKLAGDGAEATVQKDAGDDPDVTDKALIRAAVCWRGDQKVTFVAGTGVGIVTKPGLAIPPGEPAINPAPRSMITKAIREVTSRGVQVTISVEKGEELAAKTFNPRLGITGGISILGTTGIVRPFSLAALQETVRCSLSVAAAAGVKMPILVPGHIGERAARRDFNTVPEQVIETGNEWGVALDESVKHPFTALMALGHPGKLAKLIRGDFDTHSHRSQSAVGIVEAFHKAVIGRPAAKVATVEGIFMALETQQRRRLGDRLAEAVREAITKKVGDKLIVATVLIDLSGRIFGEAGDTQKWR